MQPGIVRLIGQVFAIAPAVVIAALLGACAGSGGINAVDIAELEQEATEYVIGPGDGLEVFVFAHPDLSTGVQVRPDGKISTPLVEDMVAAGKSPTQLARDIETTLGEYIRSPTVTVIVQTFVGEYDQQIRVVGQAAEPQALSYRNGMTLLDVMIEVGGLSEFASGNKAKIVRRENGQEIVLNVRIKDLLNKGRMDQNVRMMPGDVLIIPESTF